MLIVQPPLESLRGCQEAVVIRMLESVGGWGSWQETENQRVMLQEMHADRKKEVVPPLLLITLSGIPYWQNLSGNSMPKGNM